MIGQTINNYVIERQLGEGSMGVVYYARHNRIEREVAIKILHAALFTNENIRNRFKNEANALIKLNHANIVKIYDYVEHDNLACLIMENIHGVSLDQYIARVSGPMPSAKAIAVISPLLDAVQYAHDSNIYHRDIKPGNIMISKDGITVKIMDFGIAKLTDSADFKATHANAQLGTPFYMSPEQVKGLPYTRQSDIYSLGVTLFEMVTGKCPYQEITNLFVLQSKIVNEPLPSTNAYYPHVSQRLQEAIAIATDKDTEKRFKTCAEFNKYLTGEDIPGTVPVAPVQKPVENIIQPAVPLPLEDVFPEPVKKSKWWIYLLVVLGLILAAFGVYFSQKNNGIQKEPKPVAMDSLPKSLDTLPSVADTTAALPVQTEVIINKTDSTVLKQPPKDSASKGLKVVAPTLAEVKKHLISISQTLTDGEAFTSKTQTKNVRIANGNISIRCKMEDAINNETCTIKMTYKKDGGGTFRYSSPTLSTP